VPTCQPSFPRLSLLLAPTCLRHRSHSLSPLRPPYPITVTFSQSIITHLHDPPGCPAFHQRLRTSGGKGTYAISTMKNRAAMALAVPLASLFLWIWSVQACTKREYPAFSHSCEEPHALEDDFCSLTPAHAPISSSTLPSFLRPFSASWGRYTHTEISVLRGRSLAYAP
jgi:hypothetical protein